MLTTPADEMVKTEDGAVLIQVPPLSALERVVDMPVQTDVDPVMGASGYTVNVRFEIQPTPREYVIDTVPGLTPVNSPVVVEPDVIVATDVLLLVQLRLLKSKLSLT